jgi:hypothetical protein
VIPRRQTKISGRKIKEFDFIDKRERVRGNESGGYLKVGALDGEKHLA